MLILVKRDVTLIICNNELSLSKHSFVFFIIILSTSDAQLLDQISKCCWKIARVASLVAIVGKYISVKELAELYNIKSRHWTYWKSHTKHGRRRAISITYQSFFFFYFESFLYWISSGADISSVICSLGAIDLCLKGAKSRN